jgi:ectoine hydroxylase-related dioxygenase (phytanoyl-CoA dioxygenase family)
VDITTEDMGNFTVFPGWHRRRDWSNYPDEKRTKTLPDLGTPAHVCLHAGDAVVAHVLLPHRGGKNTTAARTPPAEGCSCVASDTADAPAHAPVTSLESPWHIPANTREMVFFRVRVEGVDYEAPSRAARVLENVWCELPGIAELIDASSSAAAVEASD